MKVQKLLLATTFFFTAASWAQAQSNDALTLDFYGFVRVDAYADSYKGNDSGHDVFYLLPRYMTPSGVEDFNQQPSANITAIASRLGVRVNFPDVANAKATGVLEMDFAGNLKSDPTLLRIRQAYSLLTWEKSSLLLGQTWHPFFGNANMPVVAGLNTGAPFSCFNRSPMIRYNYKMTTDLTVSMSAVSEMQYVTPMIDASSYASLLTPNHAKRNGVIPEMVLTGEWNKKAVTLGAGAEFKRIKPRMMITGTDGSAKADTYLNSMAYMAYARYKKDKLMVLAKGFMGESMSHLVMPGGYGIVSRNASTGEETYTNYSFLTSSLSMVYGAKWQVGLFAGYGVNMGTSEALMDNGSGKASTYGTSLDVQSMFRVAPHISLNLKNFRVIAEYEQTAADYGIGNINLEDGLYADSHRATNNRFIVVLTHSF
jgi:hypothetical protein